MKETGSDQMRWYTVQAFSGYEKRVQSSLFEQIKIKGLEAEFGEILVPTETVIEMRDGKKRKSERKFYPGYVLVEMMMSEEAWHLVKSTPRVLGFIGGRPERPAALQQKEVDIILRRVREGAEKPTQKTIFEPGEVVRVVDGPFAEFNGTVEKVNYEKSRIQVSVSIFGRATPVELEFTQVEKAD